MEESETVVYSMDRLWQLGAILALGLWIGFVCGMGASFGRIETVAKEKPRIEGNVTIHSAGKPVTISGFHIDMAGQNQPAIKVAP